MCYAIPGKVLEINNNTALIEYFGEKKTAVVDAGNISVGDYVYAQGGFIVQTLEADEAHGILNEWEDIFFKLKEQDERLAHEISSPVRADADIARIISKGEEGIQLTRDELLALLRCSEKDELHYLYQAANRIRQKVHRNSSCVHGIIEFSNICKNDCAYCGIRRENYKLVRYRMTEDEIVDTAVSAANESGFRAFVLQSGEDDYYTTERLSEIIHRIREKCGVLIFLSIGERDDECYRRLFDAGARGVLFRFETSNPDIYRRLHSTLHYENRLRTLQVLRDTGCVIATGSLIGLPGQGVEDLLNDILLAGSFGTEMYSFGPFIAHPHTPLASYKATDIDTMLKVIAVTRLIVHDGNILVTSAVETLFGREGTEKALMAGGNSMMTNLTPDRYRKLYSIYPGKGEADKDLQDRITETVSLLYSVGRAPTDIGMSPRLTKADENPPSPLPSPLRGEGKGEGGFERLFSDEIPAILEKTGRESLTEVESVIEKAKELKGLTPEETAILLQCKDKGLTELLCSAAEEVKKAIYGNRLVLFAPLYLTSSCVNNCLYCGFRKDNKEIERKTLSEAEIRSECEAVIRDGHKRVLLVAGEDPKRSGIAYIEKAIDVIYSTKADKGEIRRINVNVAPLRVEEYRRLKSAGIGTYQLFQETYHLPTYREMHPSGPKSNYGYRLSALGRAMEAGIDDVGMGVLFGLHDYRFEVLALLCHARQLEQEYGVGPHTVSVPRIEPAAGATLSVNPPHAVSDEDFIKIIAILRLAIPYTGIILSTRENAELRNRLFHIGASQISTNSKPYPGGYATGNEESASKGQFSIGDKRTTCEVIKHISKDGFSPSFCTACYRTGRTGQEFMEFAKPGEIQRFCLPNSILSFKEYLLDYGDEELRRTCDALIHTQTASIEDAKLRNATKKKLEEIEQGKRDLYF